MRYFTASLTAHFITRGLDSMCMEKRTDWGLTECGSCKLSTEEGDAERSRQVQGVQGLHNKGQDSLGYTVRPCLKTNKRLKQTNKKQNLITVS